MQYWNAKLDVIEERLNKQDAIFADLISKQERARALAEQIRDLTEQIKAQSKS